MTTSDNTKRLIAMEELLESIDNDDDNINKLEEAMNFYCSNHDICAGMKKAILMAVEEQVYHHWNEGDNEEQIESLDKLTAILNK